MTETFTGQLGRWQERPAKVGVLHEPTRYPAGTLMTPWPWWRKLYQVL